MSRLPDDVIGKINAHIESFLAKGSYVAGGATSEFKTCRACWLIHPAHAAWCTIKFLEDLLKEHQ